MRAMLRRSSQDRPFPSQLPCTTRASGMSVILNVITPSHCAGLMTPEAKPSSDQTRSALLMTWFQLKPWHSGCTDQPKVAGMKDDCFAHCTRWPLCSFTAIVHEWWRHRHLILLMAVDLPKAVTVLKVKFLSRRLAQCSRVLVYVLSVWWVPQTHRRPGGGTGHLLCREERWIGWPFLLWWLICAMQLSHLTLSAVHILRFISVLCHIVQRSSPPQHLPCFAACISCLLFQEKVSLSSCARLLFLFLHL